MLAIAVFIYSNDSIWAKLLLKSHPALYPVLDLYLSSWWPPAIFTYPCCQRKRCLLKVVCNRLSSRSPGYGVIACSSLGRYFWSDFVASVLLKSPVPTKGAQPAAAVAQWGLRGRRGASCPEIRKRFSPETKGPQTWAFTSAAPGWSLPHRSIQRRNIWGKNLAQLVVRHGLCVHIRTNKAIQPKAWPPGNPL